MLFRAVSPLATFSPRATPQLLVALLLLALSLACAGASPHAASRAQAGRAEASGAAGGPVAQQDARTPREAREPVAPAAETSVEFEFLRALELERSGQLEAAHAAYERVLQRDPDALPVLRRSAELSMALGRVDEALARAEHALWLDPNQPALRLLTGVVHSQRGDADAARLALADEEGVPESTPAALLLYGVFAGGERHAEALAVAEWLARTEPGTPRGYLFAARSLRALGEGARAGAMLRAGLLKNRGALSLYAALAALHREADERARELAVLEELLAEHPQHTAAWYAKAEAEWALGAREAARHTLESVERAHPARALRASLWLAQMDYARGELAAEARFARVHEELRAQEAQASARGTASASAALRAEVALELGVLRRRLGRHEDALAVLAQIPETAARYRDARLQMAWVWEAREQPARALRIVERLLARAQADARARGAAGAQPNAREAQPNVQGAQSNPPHVQLELHRAQILHRMGRRAEAFAALEAKLDGGASDAARLYQIGLLQGEEGARETALATMERVLARAPEHAGALNYIGYTLAERGAELDRAEALIERALKARPDDGFITDSLGWVYFQRAQPLLASGRVDDARAAREWLARAERELLRAQELTGGDPVISEHLGDVCAALGRPRDALAHYERAQALGPREGEQPELGAKLERLRGELQ